MAKNAAKLSITDIEKANEIGDSIRQSRQEIAKPVKNESDATYSDDPFGGAIAEMHNRIEASFSPDAKFDLPAALLPSRLDNALYMASRAFGITALIGGFVGGFALVAAIV